MISYINGTIKSINKETSKVVVDVNGLGYEVLLPLFVMRSLTDRGKVEGDEIGLQIYYHVSERQPRPVLVGFNNDFERRFFEKLIAVEGIGPSKAAQAFVFSVSTVANAIESGDAQVLQRMPGIGARTAQKIIATLKEKVAEFALLKDEGYDSMPSVTRKDIKDEAVEVLAGLGYKRADARLKVEEALEQNPGLKDTEGLIREVFRAERRS
ncbi:MAG: Holliday junction branch migration protein RuvA [Dehalococcoidia bacterium]|nr:Holliday junction ATP-dependent DNA helicase RuvA [Chloroflexota bacterium]MBT9161474.1 Holliday junction ATP-dependent DNA helicase RuvA [Chloroflexota bacterium]